MILTHSFISDHAVLLMVVDIHLLSLYDFVIDECKDLSHGEKVQKAATEWKEISLQEKEKYEMLSTSIKNIEVDKLTDPQKDKLILRHTKRLVEEVSNVQ